MDGASRSTSSRPAPIGTTRRSWRPPWPGSTSSTGSRTGPRSTWIAATTAALLDALGFDGAIARKGVPAPVQAGARWVVERTHQWMNGYGKLRRRTEKRQAVVDCYLFLAAALVVIRQLIQRARLRYRWPTRPTSRRLK